MAWLERFSLVMTSSITTLREKFEDPERMLHQLILDMDDELETVRRGVALAIADEIQLRKRAEKARKEAEAWHDRAAAALQRGEESTAQSALEQRILAEERAETLTEEHAKQKTQTAKLQRAVRDLEDQIRQAQQKRTLLLARLARASSARRINDALDRCGSRSAFAQFRRLEDRVDRAEAMSEAYDRLDGRDPEAEELEQSLAAAERKAQARSEFEELKRRLAEEGGGGGLRLEAGGWRLEAGGWRLEANRGMGRGAIRPFKTRMQGAESPCVLRRARSAIGSRCERPRPALRWAESRGRSRLAQTWWSIDRVRAARREGRILRLRPPAAIVLDGREIEVLRRGVTHGAEGVLLTYECRSTAGPAQIRVTIESPVAAPRIVWIENGREELRGEDDFEIW